MCEAGSVCAADSICQPCGGMDELCCQDQTCSEWHTCGPDGTCIRCGDPSGEACPDGSCRYWFLESDGECKIAFFADPEADISVCENARDADPSNSYIGDRDWCYWYAAFLLYDTSNCEDIVWDDIRELCLAGENPMDYYVGIEIYP
ncbi:MAG: hypothetical protein PVJ07_06020 [Anaerolineales bacterium]